MKASLKLVKFQHKKQNVRFVHANVEKKLTQAHTDKVYVFSFAIADFCCCFFLFAFIYNIDSTSKMKHKKSERKLWSKKFLIQKSYGKKVR